MRTVVDRGTRVTCTVTSIAEALACSQRAADFARGAGFGRGDTWAVGIAVSELATNVVRHAGGGRIEIALTSQPAPGLSIVASDSGPGIADVPSAILDGHSRGLTLERDVPHGQRQSLGTGLGAVARLTDDLRIEPAPEGGTVVIAFKRLPDDISAPRAGGTRTVLLGLGNSILSDDGVGIKVVRRIAQLGPHPGIDIKTAEVAGFALLDLLEGYDRAVIVDAVRLRDAEPGDVNIIELGSIETSLHLVAGHQIDLASALELGRRLERPVPSVVRIVGVQICDDTTFSEQCTPAVNAAIPLAASIAMRVASLDR